MILYHLTRPVSFFISRDVKGRVKWCKVQMRSLIFLEITKQIVLEIVTFSLSTCSFFFISVWIVYWSHSKSYSKDNKNTMIHAILLLVFHVSYHFMFLVVSGFFFFLWNKYTNLICILFQTNLFHNSFTLGADFWMSLRILRDYHNFVTWRFSYARLRMDEHRTEYSVCDKYDRSQKIYQRRGFSNADPFGR